MHIGEMEIGIDPPQKNPGKSKLPTRHPPRATYTGGGVWSANRTARHMTRAISEIHIMAAPTDRRGGGVCRICSDIVLSVASQNFTLRVARSL